MALIPWCRHQRKRFACRVGKSNESGFELMAAAPARSALMSCSVSATPWFISQNIAAER